MRSMSNENMTTAIVAGETLIYQRNGKDFRLTGGSSRLVCLASDGHYLFLSQCVWNLHRTQRKRRAISEAGGTGLPITSGMASTPGRRWQGAGGHPERMERSKGAVSGQNEHEIVP